ncbi:MAG: hypothetical protein Ct9H300mP27_06760 [Chloroflexota bacterium]|nr:MAG: hypothetical protein Ct9H300mP27_06760 [Chloroflexota bacterium]
MNWYLVSVASLFMLIFVVGCGTSESSVQPPIPTTPISKPAPIVTNQVDSVSSQDAQNDSLNGEEIFAGSGGCGACHTIEGLTTAGVGPELTNMVRMLQAESQVYPLVNILKSRSVRQKHSCRKALKEPCQV